MPNYSTARTNMVDSQIHTAGVVSAPVLQAFRTVPREDFVPDELKGLVYADEDLMLGHGHFLMEPAILARMIEAVAVKTGDKVLNVGDSTGYSTAILSQLTALPVSTPETAQPAESYSLIVMNGAIGETPAQLQSMLEPQGRLIGILKPEGSRVGTVTIVEKIADNHFSTRKLFEAGTPYIPGYEPRSKFSL